VGIAVNSQKLQRPVQNEEDLRIGMAVQENRKARLLTVSAQKRRKRQPEPPGFDAKGRKR
jgi:hypothetical protein